MFVFFRTLFVFLIETFLVYKIFNWLPSQINFFFFEFTAFFCSIQNFHPKFSDDSLTMHHGKTFFHNFTLSAVRAVSCWKTKHPKRYVSVFLKIKSEKLRFEIKRFSSMFEPMEVSFWKCEKSIFQLESFSLDCLWGSTWKVFICCWGDFKILSCNYFLNFNKFSLTRGRKLIGFVNMLKLNIVK